MNPHQLKRLFPNASASVLAANESDYGSGTPRNRTESPAIEPEPVGQAIVPQAPAGGLKPYDHQTDNPRQVAKLERRKWTDAEIAGLMAAYLDEKGISLKELANRFNRTIAAIACKADDMGLCSRRGKYVRSPETRAKCSQVQRMIGAKPEIKAHRAAATAEAWKKYGHPKGFKGHKRTAAELAKMKEGSEKARANPSHKFNSPEYRQALSDRFSKLAATRNPENCYSRTKGGWREVGGKRFFARSRWEANYARYLQWLKERGMIQEWEHEPETFWFEKIKRGVRSYLPDFRVTCAAGTIEYHEVKGWMDNKSKTKIKRMAKYFPAVLLRVFDQAWFKRESKKLRGLIPGWEHSK